VPRQFTSESAKLAQRATSDEDEEDSSDDDEKPAKKVCPLAAAAFRCISANS
jgi:hypothetical protein